MELQLSAPNDRATVTATVLLYRGGLALLRFKLDSAIIDPIRNHPLSPPSLGGSVLEHCNILSPVRKGCAFAMAKLRRGDRLHDRLKSIPAPKFDLSMEIVDPTGLYPPKNASAARPLDDDPDFIVCSMQPYFEYNMIWAADSPSRPFTAQMEGSSMLIHRLAVLPQPQQGQDPKAWVIGIVQAESGPQAAIESEAEAEPAS